MGLNRRQFLHWGAATGLLGSSLAAPVSAQQHREPARSLRILNLHTGERVNATYWEKGEYLVDGLAEIYLLMRDHRQNLIAPIDVRVLDQLHQVNTLVSNNQEIHLISGYRSPKTNDMLRGKSRNVAKHSFHMKGQAIDFALPGTHLRHVHKAALSAHQGGVGYYPRGGYLHIDTGRKRNWAV